ncbi:Cof-type HAD-IIB family hydrolase [Paenibacillus marinisediminis]
MDREKCKIVFFDIDGTLLSSNQQIPESTIRAVRSLQEMGIETVISTGRTPANFGHIREQLGIHSYISLNGNYVVREGEVLSQVKVKQRSMEQLNEIATACGHAIGWIGTDQIGMHAAHPMIAPILNTYGMEVPPVNPQFHLQNDVYQGMLFCTEEEIQPYVEGVPEMKYVRFDRHVVDVLPRESNKAVGISNYLSAIGVPAESCVAFGDGLNDIEMLQCVGLGIAMGQAKDEVKRAAKHVTRSVDDDGIEAALLDLGFISA